ncbi:protein PFC0760c isoform X1 [Vespa velutina]|uniref:protein PFC0760c isoform X1 n=1 Tax=Vespa velutina TaxID=202808 RepID=UPI001FB32B96|nr:protein PFC0760c isoform X1 [Vespa velutina]
MYKIIIIYLLCAIGIISSEQPDNIFENVNEKGLSIIDKYSSNRRFARAKRSFIFLLPIEEEHENVNNEITEKTRQSKTMKRRKSALFTTTSIPLTKMYKNKAIKAEKSREPYVGFNFLNEIREKRQKESTDKKNDVELSSEKNLSIESYETSYPSDKKYRENSKRLVCYCHKENCQDCQSKRKLLNSHLKDPKNKGKGDKYRKINSNDYKITEIPLRLSKLYEEIPYDLKSNYANSEKMQILPIIHGISPRVYPLTVPFRVTYEQTEPHVGMNTPVSQEYQQNSNKKQQTLLKQYILTTKNQSEILQKSNTSILKDNKRNNDFSTTMNYPEHEESDLNSMKEIDEDSSDANMLECIKLYGRKVCLLAAATACKYWNKNKDQKDENVGSIRNRYDTTEQSSVYDINEDHYDSTISDILIDSKENNFDDNLIYKKESTENYNENNHDSTTSNVLKDSMENNFDDNLIYKKQSTENYNEDNHDSTTSNVLKDSMENNFDHNLIYKKQSTENYNEDNHDSTTSNVLKDSMENNFDDDLIYKKQSTENYNEDNHDSTTSNVILETSEYIITNTDNYTTSTDDSFTKQSTTYYTSDEDIKIREYANPTDMSILQATQNSQEQDQLSTTLLIDSNVINDIEYTTSTAITNNINFNDSMVTNEDNNLTDTILNDDRTHYITHSELDYSDIQEITNSYFTSQSYDKFDENGYNSDLFTYDHHLSKNNLTNLIDDSPNVEATNIPDVTNDRANSQNVLSIEINPDLIENQISINSTVENNLDDDKTITEDNNDSLRKENIENREDIKDDPKKKESGLKYDTQNLSSFTSTTEQEQITIDSSLGYTKSSLDYETNNVDVYSTDISNLCTLSIDINSPIGCTENEKKATINDYEIPVTISTTNEIKLQTSNQDLTTTEETTTTTTTIEIATEKETHDKINDSIVGLSNEGEFVKLSEEFDTTLNPITFVADYTKTDNEINTLKNILKYDVESTTPNLSFYDNIQLVNSIKKIINNFNSNDRNLGDPKDFTKIADNVELSPEIVGIPNLRSLLSLTPVENVIIKKVKDHLSKITGIPKNALFDEESNNVIRQTLKNTLNLLPNMQSELPPMTVEEHQFQGGHWTTNLVTLLPLTSSERTKKQDISRRLQNHIKDLIYNPAIGLESVKQNAVQNIIIQATKHQMENANDMDIEEDTIRDILGNVLQDNSYDSNQRKTKINSENISTMEDTRNYDETTTENISMKDNRFETLKSTTDNSLANSYYDDFITDKEFPKMTINKIQPNDYSNDVRDSYILSTEFYEENLQKYQSTESIYVYETTFTSNVANINEETLEMSQPETQSDQSNSNKVKANESEVLRLSQNSIVGVDNPKINETGSANEGFLEEKEKRRLCKIENCTSEHEIVTKFNERVKTTKGVKSKGMEDASSFERNPIISKAPEVDDITSNFETNENIEDINENDDDNTKIYKNLNHQDYDSEEDVIYKEEAFKTKTNDIDNDKNNLWDLQNSELYYVGDNVKFPLEIKKLKDGSYILLISRKICENVLKNNCPCCVPLEGNVRLIKRSTEEISNDNNDNKTFDKKNNQYSEQRSKIMKSNPLRQRTPRSMILNKKLDDSDENNSEILTMPVIAFAKKYNLKLNLDDTEIDDVKEAKNTYCDENDKIKRNNPIFQRMKFVKRMQNNYEPYRQQRAIKQNSNSSTEILKNVINWLRTLFVN